ncbi:DUF3055 domain-containing protein [Alkalihalobacterium alkalinitrilicum]|uniref:DUF3055 domain-containing protein n=1 Tax=Alkalihalobacterium alkalinitrilicum TaxID=427920 RepID=UPI00099519A1|nr:DUF3055 domain-containing protein [Alkalihalobacterium alkalinitrilicum]
MNLFERLYDEQENVKVQFIGFTTDDVRYDFGIVYTNMFFGKPLVVCMQTGRSGLLCADDVKNVDHIQKVFHIRSAKEAEDLATFFEQTLPTMPLEPQY